jgi:hypothetical protein
MDSRSSRQWASRRSARCRSDRIDPYRQDAESHSRGVTLGGSGKRDSTVSQLQMNSCPRPRGRREPPRWGNAPARRRHKKTHVTGYLTSTWMSRVHEVVTKGPAERGRSQSRSCSQNSPHSDSRDDTSDRCRPTSSTMRDREANGAFAEESTAVRLGRQEPP